MDMATAKRSAECGCSSCAAGRGQAEAVPAVEELKQLPVALYRRSSYAVAPGSAAAVRQAAREYAAQVGDHEPGTLLYLVLEPQGGNGEFLHVAAFRDAAALSASQGSAAYQRFVEVLRPVLAGEVRVEAAEAAAAAETGSRLISRSDVSVQVKLTVRRRSDLPRFQRLVVAFTHRQQDGLLCSDAFREPDDDRVFFIYERWVSQQAIDAAQGGKLQLELLALATLEVEQVFSTT
jgi:quinol monooxygenase YgiN